jgi:hypothetical protein
MDGSTDGAGAGAAAVPSAEEDFGGARLRPAATSIGTSACGSAGGLRTAVFPLLKMDLKRDCIE